MYLGEIIRTHVSQNCLQKNGENGFLKKSRHTALRTYWHIYFRCISLNSRFWCRHRKDELERRMSALQESRRELMVQLEGLMRLLKVKQSPVSGRFQCDKTASESVFLSKDVAYTLTWSPKSAVLLQHSSNANLIYKILFSKLGFMFD